LRNEKRKTGPLKKRGADQGEKEQGAGKWVGGWRGKKKKGKKPGGSRRNGNGENTLRGRKGWFTGNHQKSKLDNKTRRKNMIGGGKKVNVAKGKVTGKKQ